MSLNPKIIYIGDILISQVKNTSEGQYVVFKTFVQGVPKKFTKVVGYNFACVLNFLMKFRYVIGIGCKFFHKKFQGSSLKNVRIILKKLFLQCLRYLYAYNSACEYQKCTKIW